MFDNNEVILPLADTHPHHNRPPILMPEALSIISIPTLLFSKLKTILPCLAAPELSLQLLIIPGEASVLEASVVSICSQHPPAQICLCSHHQSHTQGTWQECHHQALENKGSDSKRDKTSLSY